MGAFSQLDTCAHERKLSVSVIVPCAPVHITHLRQLVDMLQTQSRKPDQIILAISGCEISAFPIVDADITHSREAHTAGSNRNRGSVAANGDVVIYQDADDVPHPQRVEIIAGLFEKYQIDHLMHFYNRSVDPCTSFSLDEAANRTTYRTDLAADVTNGNPAVARTLLLSVRWPEYARRGEDVEFNRAVYARTKRTAVVELPLLTYRQKLSSFKRLVR